MSRRDKVERENERVPYDVAITIIQLEYALDLIFAFSIETEAS